MSQTNSITGNNYIHYIWCNLFRKKIFCNIFYDTLTHPPSPPQLPVKTKPLRSRFQERLPSSCPSSRVFSSINSLVKQEKATQSNRRAWMSDRDRRKRGIKRKKHGCMWKVGGGHANLRAQRIWAVEDLPFIWYPAWLLNPRWVAGRANVGMEKYKSLSTKTYLKNY